ncbi:hypothetical protein LCGC14_0181130 [marine sediment metagenome]|uniref:Uncharacterized protein n=1 Tax=marine sediment metagenome TaxID=412755 RepID=A0A0F9UPH7_9ZZZZ
MKVPLLKLKEQFAALRDEIIDAIVPILDNQRGVNGPEIGQFEQLIAD